MSFTENDQLNDAKAKVRADYGENRKIADGNYDKSLAVRCVNGTFVGRKKENIIAYKGIPFVGKQPVGEYRWKAPVDYVQDDGVYEAYYNGKTPCQGGASAKWLPCMSRAKTACT
jgi:para-nitrobenzyl esterase